MQSLSTSTFQKAATISPVVLRSTDSEGNLYAQCKNSFLHFTTDYDRLIKSAAIRSGSADAILSKRNIGIVRRDNDFCKDLSSLSTLSGTSTDVDEIASCGASGGDSTPRMTPMLSSTPKYMQADMLMRPVEEVNLNMVESYWHPIAMVNYDAWFEGSSGVEDSQISATVVNNNPTSSRMEENWLLTGTVNGNLMSKVKAAKPSRKNRKNAESISSENVTTLMIRGLPCSFRQESLLDWIDSSGFQGMYDFFYLPRCGDSASNLGYAFINFVNPSQARSFMSTLNGVQLNPRNSAKVCSVSAADIQGLAQLRKHFRRTAVSRGSRGPIFMKCNMRGISPTMTCKSA